MTKEVYNLVFPLGIDRFALGKYVFEKIDGYKAAYDKLQHISRVPPTQGTHQITSTVTIPLDEKSAVLPWDDEDPKQLLDIMLLLTIFTRRSVFYKNWDGETVILEDDTLYPWGGEIWLSLPKRGAWRDRRTGSIFNEIPDPETGAHVDWANFGFEKGLNEVLTRISSDEWQNKYTGRGHSGGYFLLLFKHAMRRQVIELTFTSCWTIWEHIFALHNSSWLDTRSLVRMSGKEKIAFVYKTYFDKRTIPTEKLVTLYDIRNRVTHYGMRSTVNDNPCMKEFIQETERLIATILGLTPSYELSSGPICE